MGTGGINTTDTGIRVQMDTSRTRQTPDTSFSNTLKSGLNRSANAVASVSQLASPFVPGAALVSAAISSVGQVKSAAMGAGGSNSVALSAGSVVPAGIGSATGAGSSFDAVAQNAASGDSGAQMLMATREMQEMNQNFNLQYLQLQQNMQSEQRRFNVLSNIARIRHDAMKNTIGNFR